MMDYDRKAERYLDKVLPETRTIDPRDLERMGIDPSLHDMANEIIEEARGRTGVAPTLDQVVSEFRRRQAAQRRIGI